MTNRPEAVAGHGWLEAAGIPHILRTLAIALQPTKLVLALAAIVITLFLGWTLDAIWSPVVKLDEAAIAHFIMARDLDAPYVEPEGQLGIFHVFRLHEQRALLGFMGSLIPGFPTSSLAGAFRNLQAMGYGVLWMMQHHVVYFLVFSLGAIAIWSLFGGAICRMAAMQFARDELITARQALDYARRRWFGGFFLAPCVPLIFAALGVGALALGGALMRVPMLDVAAALVFVLALLVGFGIAALLAGFALGGSLFWPAVATDGLDAFDTFSRAVSYPITRPLKAALYALLLAVYGSICWVAANFFVYVALSITRWAVGFGSAWWGYTQGEASTRKLNVLWPMEGPNGLWSAPDWTALSWYEDLSAALIAFWILAVLGLLWAFLCTFYFSGSTVAYCLLRRDVDLMETDEVFVEEETAPQDGAAARSPGPSPDDGDIALPVSTPSSANSS